MFGPAGQALEQLDRALDAVADAVGADVGAWALALLQRTQRLEAIATRAARDFDVRGDFGNAHGSVPWLANRCRMPKARVKRLVGNGRALERMPEVDAAFARGDLSSDHVRVLAAAETLNPKAFTKAEEQLVSDATTERFDTFCRRVAYWRQEAEPDVVEDEAAAAHDRRSLHASTTFEDVVAVDATLDPVGGAIYLGELTRLERLLFEQDWAAARARLGHEPCVVDLDRTPAQRRADAQVLMAERSAAKAPGAVEPRVLLQVLVGYETFAGRICELADGTVLTPGQVVSLLEQADVQRVVFESPSRVIDVGAKQRLFRGATRTAVELVDLECQGDPSCDVRFPDCEVDHLEPFGWGGATVRANGGLKCKWHHRRRQRSP
ncbi:MAG TPA: DUF222 domain-containing protein [Acidimicrobiales bacterium]|nr:DUF222 domain-containing protein [Acidimicrobiales bacterium]